MPGGPKARQASQLYKSHDAALPRGRELPVVLHEENSTENKVSAGQRLERSKEGRASGQWAGAALGAYQGRTVALYRAYVSGSVQSTSVRPCT